MELKIISRFWPYTTSESTTAKSVLFNSVFSSGSSIEESPSSEPSPAESASPSPASVSSSLSCSLASPVSKISEF